MNELVQLGDGKWWLMKLQPCEHGGVNGAPIKLFTSLEDAEHARQSGLEFRVSKWSRLGM
jgi:hypothetical protein